MTYVTLKQSAELVNYLLLQDLPQKSRKLFCAFWISCHDFQIKRERGGGAATLPKFPMRDICETQPETEQHILLCCPEYRRLRLDLFKNIST